MGNDEFTATASNMKNDVEKASASSNNDEDTNKANKKMVWNYDEGYYEIDNEEWEIRNIWLELEGLKESPPLKDRAAECCIYRVPNSLRVSNPEAYTPQLISIGLFHHNSERLNAMETLKRRYQGEELPHPYITFCKDDRAGCCLRH
ncbi:hypothetical protein OIU78_027947 [Salix suchowensis]|nr:hypothetical protein OIU78_027947 [Salix suchowensis]